MTNQPAPPARPGDRPSGDRPDIVVVMADDLACMDLGCYGSPHISTPNLDRLASEGLLFTHAYAPSPWCSPSRVGGYTGRYPGRLFVGLEEPLRTRSERHGIPHGHPTLPSLLAAAGYRTAMFGKWHCGWLPDFSPLRIGFDTFFGNLDGAVDYHEHIDTLGQPDLYEQETPVQVPGYYTDLITDRAASWVAEQTDGPFFAQVNYTAPHWPWEGRGDAAVGARIRRDSEQGGFVPLLHTDGGSLAKYAEMVEAMDDGIGKILHALAVAGRSDNTIVLFTADNGGERWSMTWPFVGEKGDLTEGGIRVPLLVRWPKAVAPAQTSSRPSTTLDWTATLLTAAGTGPHPDWPLDGADLYGWLTTGAAYPDHDLFWRTESQGALRRGQWKYVRDHRDRALIGNWPLFPRLVGRPFELLYDLSADGREAADVARHHPDLVAELRDAWDKTNNELLAYPPDHPSLARLAGAGRPAVSAED